MKRGYFVCGDDTAAGFAVVASSVEEAKKIAYKAELSFNYDWTDIRCRWQRGSDVSNLPIGMVEDEKAALLRGLYAYLIEYPCDGCGNDADVICHNGRALCEDCIENDK